MGHIYFDESIHDRGGFILGACVCSTLDLSPMVHNLWSSLELDPTRFEYKSSAPKFENPAGQDHRTLIHGLLWDSRVGLTVCPISDRRNLGVHAVELAKQVIATQSIGPSPHILYLDENIHLHEQVRRDAQALDLAVRANQNSCIVGGLQVADHAAHTLAGMLLEEMGLLTKQIRAGEGSGYDPELLINLGFELWASLRYSLLAGPNNASLDDDQLVSATFPLEGFGLYVAPSWAKPLRQKVLSRFGTNYVGCIH